MQIYDVLKADHDTLKQLLDELVGLPEGASFRSDLVQQIRDELIPHARAEEAVFYNPLRAAGASSVMHSYLEHIQAETHLRALQAKDKMDLDTRTTANRLRDSLMSHIQDEESKIFQEARKYFSAEEAELMAKAFEKLKTEVKPEGILKTTFDLVRNLMPPRFAGTIDKPFDKSA